MAARKVGSRVRGQRGSLGHVTGRMGGWGGAGCPCHALELDEFTLPDGSMAKDFAFMLHFQHSRFPFFFFKSRFTPSHLKDIYIFSFISIFICRAVGFKSLSWSA